MVRKLFATDGIRGIANRYPIDADTMLKLGKSVSKVLCEKKKHPKIVIGKDTRLSGYMLEYALVAGLTSMGSDVLLVGPMPTPAIAHLVKSFAADVGIMISASHNSYEDNGIKIFSEDGYKISDKIEMEIESYLTGEKKLDEGPTHEGIGSVKRIDDARGRYIEYTKGTIDNMSLNGLKIVLDCANGAAYHITPNILKELGAEVIVLNDDPDGKNINKDCGATDPKKLREVVLKEKADIGIALDGDADRVVMVDEIGNYVDGDCILGICAEYYQEKGTLANNTVVGTVLTNYGLEEFLSKRGIKLVRTQVGDKYIHEEMIKNGYNLGGEPCGHLLFFDFSTIDDATIGSLQFLRILKEKNIKLSECLTKLKLYPSIMHNIVVKEKKPLEDMPNVQKKIEEMKEKLGDGRIIVRYSGTENKCRIMVEGRDETKIKEIAEEIEKEIIKEEGERK